MNSYLKLIFISLIFGALTSCETEPLPETNDTVNPQKIFLEGGDEYDDIDDKN